MTIQNDPRTKADILTTMQRIKQEVADAFTRVPADQFFRTSPEGWSPAENLVHLIKSASPVGKAMKLPKLVSAGIFGTTKAGSMPFAELRDKYLEQLHNGAQATGPYVPEVETTPPDAEQAKRATLEKWNEVADRLLEALQGWTEAELDKYTLPHPLLGKLTVREMLFFTLYHNVHHANEARVFMGERALVI